MQTRVMAATASDAPGNRAGARGLPGRAYLPIALLLLGYALIVLLTFRDYGITFDEYFQATYGEHILNWYRSAFRDRDVLSYGNLELYGGFFDALAQVATRLSPFGRYETRHLFNALFGAVGVFAAWRIGVRLAGPRAGFLAALFLLFTPVWYGHSFANPKDVPFAVLYLLTLDAILAAVPHFPRVSWKQTAWIGVTLGLTLAVRFGGILLFGYLGFAFLAWLLWRWGALDARPTLRGALLPFAGRAAAVLGLAWLVMLPWWPAAQVDPLRHPLHTLRELSNFDWNYPVLFDGREILATQLPWTYLPRWALLTLPEFVLLGLGAAAVFALLALVRARRTTIPAEAVPPTTLHGGEPPAPESRRIDPVRVIQWSTLLFAVLFPVVYAIATHAVLYDGLRHFLFAVPLIVIVGAVGFAKLLALPRIAGWAAAAALAIGLAWVAVDMVRIHPYQYIWFNHAVAGGLQNAGKSYESDYWGAAYKEAAEWVAKTYTDAPADRRIRVASCSQRTGTEYYLPQDRFQFVGRQQSPDLFLGARRFGCIDRIEGRVVHTIERLGIPLVTIKETSGFAAGEAR